MAPQTKVTVLPGVISHGGYVTQSVTVTLLLVSIWLRWHPANILDPVSEMTNKRKEPLTLPSQLE
jgi:hypothetical protein